MAGVDVGGIEGHGGFRILNGFRSSSLLGEEYRVKIPGLRFVGLELNGTAEMRLGFLTAA